MDLVTLALAKGYTDKSRLCYTEPVVDIEWDGNIGDRYHIIDMVDMLGFVKVSDYLPPVDALSNAIMTISKSGTETESKASIAAEMSNASCTVLVNEDRQGIVVIVREPDFSLEGSETFVFKETGIYFMVSGHYVSKLHIGGTVHKLPAEYAPEIPVFDFTQMGLPAVVPDMAGTGEFVQAAGDFSEFENALQRGAVWVRVTVNTGTREAHITSMVLPFYEEGNQVWQLTMIGVIGFDQPTLRVSAMYFPPNSVANNTAFGVLRVNCALLRHFTM